MSALSHRQRGARLALTPLLLGVAPLFITAACSRSIPLTPRGPHPATDGVLPIVVASQPPPVKVQVIPPPPNDDCQWADGEWVWRSSEWRWRDGAWLSASAGCYFAEAVFVWLKARNAPNGLLYYTRSQWYDRKTNEQCEAPPVCQPAPNGE